MKIYLLTAAGVIFISVIVSLLIPEGKLNKTVTFIMRLICILVLIKPITGIFGIKNEQPVSDFIDYGYVETAYSENQSAQLEKLLLKEFEVETDCVVNICYENGEFKAKSVEVGLEKNNEKLFKEIYSYLSDCGYINITVYAQST